MRKLAVLVTGLALVSLAMVTQSIGGSDGLAFLFAIPLFELIDFAQAGHWLRVIAHLP